MPLTVGFQWASLLLSFLAAILAAYSTARMPIRLARAMPTFWGSLVPAKVVLEQKAYSAGALWAVSSASLSQLLSLLPSSSGSGLIPLTASIVLTVVIATFTLRLRRLFVTGYLRRIAGSKNSPQGELAEVERIRSPSSSDEFIEQIGLLYDLPRRRREPTDTFKQRLEQHIRRLAEGRRED
jgi:hypothetical protein